MSEEESAEYKAKEKGTGSSISVSEFTRLVVPFDNYEIVVRVSHDGRFLGIDEVRIRQDLRRYTQQVSEKSFNYIDEYHPE